MKVDGTAQVAGRDAYKLVVKPKQSGSTVGAITIAVDAKTGLPLKFTLTPASGGAAVVDVGLHPGRLLRAGRVHLRLHPAEGREGHRGRRTADTGKGLRRGMGRAHATGSGTAVPKGWRGARRRCKVIGKGWNSIAEFDTGGDGPAVRRRGPAAATSTAS